MCADSSGEPVRGVPYLRVGERLGAYRIESFVALGGMAFVYEATDMRLGRHVALKVLAPALSVESDFRERFMRESRFAASLDHPNIVPIYEAGELDGLLFIAMRFVQGTNLDAHLHKVGRLDLQRTLAILTPIAEALDAAHDAGLVHRDVKPANILLGPSGRQGREHVYLTDFGITKRTSGLTKLTATGNVVGTMSYTSPEQIKGEKVDAGTDLYSFGCVVYQCLTGVAPFVRDNQGALVWAHLNEHPPPVSSHRPGLAPVDAVVARALRKNPHDRFGLCQDFTDAMREALSVVGDEADQSTEVILTPLRRAASAETTVGSGNLSTSPSTRQEAPEGPGPAAGTVDPPRPPPPHHRAGWARRRRTIIVALAGSAIVALAGSAAVALSVSELGAGTAETMDQASNAAVGSSTSVPVLTTKSAPDVAASGTLRSADPSTGPGPGPGSAGHEASATAVSQASAVPPRQSVAIPTVDRSFAVGTTPGFVTITPNGRQAYIANRNDGIVTVLDTASDAVVAKIPITGGPPRFIAFTQDGRTAYVSIYNDQKTINLVQVLDAVRSQPGETIAVGARPVALAVNPNQAEIWVPSHDTGAVDIISIKTETVVEKLPVAPNPHWVTFSTDATVAYIANHESNLVSAYDTATRKLIKKIPVGTSPHSVAVSPDGKEVAVVCFGSNDVYIIDTATNSVTKRVAVGINPQDITYTPDGRYLYTANVESDNISVIDAGTRKVTATIPTDSPTSIAFLPDGSRAYVTNLDTGTITVLSTAVV